MYKIAILGCENSHANSFLKLITEGLYPDLQVVGVYSDDAAAAAKLNEQFGVEVMDNYDSLVGQVDGVMVTARHGDNHYKYAKPYLQSGIPMFIDKPITCSDEEGVAFMKEAKQLSVRLCGGSTCAYLSETLELAEAVKESSCGDLRGGSVVCPYYPDSPYGGFHFYAQHLVDVMIAVFGDKILRVRADETNNSLSFTAVYDGFSVQGIYVRSTGYYSVSVFGSKSIRTEQLTFNNKSFCHEMDDMLHLLKGGEMKKSYEQFILPVFVINAIQRSVETGEWVCIPAAKI